MKNYIIRIEDKIVATQYKYVAIDQASGGYPYFVGTPAQAKIWCDKDEALKYIDMFKTSSLRSAELCH